MSESLPPLDRARLRAKVLARLEHLVEEVADTVDSEPAGRVIRDSEVKVKNLVDEFCREMYKMAIQAKVHARDDTTGLPNSGNHADRVSEVSVQGCRDLPPAGA